MQSNSPGAGSPPNAIGVGDLIDGKYRLTRVIGEGGWGIVFEGENLRTMRRVAIKILRAQANVTPDIQARFEREAQAAGRIGSEHIVEVFDLGTLPNGTSYMVMELLSGQDLAARLESGRLDPVVASSIIIQILEGLGAAHQAGILHRDLKPENLFLVPTRTGEEFVKILDFGISKFNTNTPGAVSATMTGAVLGSPVYMAPEQARGLKQIDARADLYSVGALFYECVTGRLPFEGDNFNDLMFKIVLAPRPNPLEFRPDLDPGLAPILLKSIAVDPGHRFQSAVEFREAILGWMSSVGVEPAIPLELRRAGRATPRGPSGLTPKPGKGEPHHWGAATVSADGASGTPLSAASTIPGGRKSGRNRLPFIILGTAVSLLAVAAVVAMRHRAAVTTSAAASPSSPTATAVVEATTEGHAAPPTALVQQAATATEETTPAAAAAASGSASHAPPNGRSRWWTPPPTKAGHNAGPKATADEQPKVAESAPPAAAPPPAPPPAPAAPVSTVEGREIRTGL